MPDIKEKLVELLRNSPHLDVIKGYKGDDCTFEQGADWLIAHGVTVQKWISVEERLPEQYYKDVLVYDKRDGVQFIAVLTYKGEWLIPHYEGYIFNITHWMPLPEPPKGE